MQVESARTHMHSNQFPHVVVVFFFFFSLFNGGVKGQKAEHKSVVAALKVRVFADARVRVLGECGGGFSPFFFLLDDFQRFCRLIGVWHVLFLAVEANTTSHRGSWRLLGSALTTSVYISPSLTGLSFQDSTRYTLKRKEKKKNHTNKRVHVSDGTSRRSGVFLNTHSAQ